MGCCCVEQYTAPLVNTFHNGGSIIGSIAAKNDCSIVSKTGKIYQSCKRLVYEHLINASWDGNICIVLQTLQYLTDDIQDQKVMERAFITACQVGHMDIIHVFLSNVHMPKCLQHLAEVHIMAPAIVSKPIAEAITAPPVAASQNAVCINIHAENDKAIRHAAQTGRTEVVRLLIQHHANLHAEEDEALRLACNNGYLDVVLLLLSHGADVHAKNDEALRTACMKEDRHCLDIIRLLLEHGADPNAVQTIPLYFADFITVMMIHYGKYGNDGNRPPYFTRLSRPTDWRPWSETGVSKSSQRNIIEFARLLHLSDCLTGLDKEYLAVSKCLHALDQWALDHQTLDHQALDHQVLDYHHYCSYLVLDQIAQTTEVFRVDVKQEVAQLKQENRDVLSILVGML